MGETDDLEWDDVKNTSNLEKHGLELALAALLFDGRPRLERPSPNLIAGESRFEVLAEIDGRVLFCVFVWRGARRRIISLRPTHRSERRAYKKAVGERQAPSAGA